MSFPPEERKKRWRRSYPLWVKRKRIENSPSLTLALSPKGRG
jgi:hypothetical protein